MTYTADTYQLDERANAGSWVNIYAGSSTSAAISGKPTGAYEYRVRACNASGCGSYSALGVTNVVRPPAAAPTITAPPMSPNGTFTIAWSAVATSTTYQLEELVGGAWTSVPSTGTAVAFSGRGNGSYSFRVRACNAGGCGGYSATVTAGVLLPPQNAPGMSAPASATGAYTVSWSAVTGAAYYSVHQNINGAGWIWVSDHTGTSTSFNPGSAGSYAYRVIACNSSGCGPWSAIGTVNVIRAPGVPSITFAYQHWYYAGPHNSEFASCSVRWTGVGGADRYELHAGDGGVVYGQMYSGPSNEIEGGGYSIQYCAYSYVVRACNAAGCSGWSSEFPATIVRDEPPTNPGDPPL